MILSLEEVKKEAPTRRAAIYRLKELELNIQMHCKMAKKQASPNHVPIILNSLICSIFRLTLPTISPEGKNKLLMRAISDLGMNFSEAIMVKETSLTLEEDVTCRA